MKHTPYLRTRGRELTLNDYLAIDRTVLANERTLLSYSRTALALLVIGGSCLTFFESWWIEAVGAVFIAASVALAIQGWHRFRRIRAYLAAALEDRTGVPEHPLKETIKADS